MKVVFDLFCLENKGGQPYVVLAEGFEQMEPISFDDKKSSLL